MKKNRDRKLLVIGIYGVIAFILLRLDPIPVQYRKLYSFSYTLIEYLFFSLFIYLNLHNKYFKRIVILLSLCFIVFQYFYYLSSIIGRLDSVAVGIETILLFIYIFFFFYENLKSPSTLEIYYNYCFWIAIGIMMYLGGGFFFYILIEHMVIKEIAKYSYLTYIAEIFKNVFFIIGIFVFVYRQKESINSLKPTPPSYLDLDMN